MKLTWAVPAILAVLLPAAPADAARGQRSSADCPAARAVPDRSNLSDVQQATVCLINAERDRRGLRDVRPDGRLARAAERHVDDMIRHRYFAHDSRNGDSFSDRIRATGYLARVRAWVIGENLAWGSGAQASPGEIVAGWMRSPGHRANILNTRYREVGIGLGLGTPRGGSGATYATEFGAVTGRAAASRRTARSRGR